MRTPFLGSAYVSRSSNLAGQRLINLYPEVVETKSGKDTGAFYGCPGLDLLTICGNGPIRGMAIMASTLYVVSGNQVYSVSTSWIAALIGSISTGPGYALTGPVSMIANETQLAIFDGVNGWLVTGGVLSQLSLPFANPTMAAYQDTFGLCVQGGSNIVWQSNVADISTWSALNFSAINAQPDPMVAIGQLHREMWMIGQWNTEIWQDAGNSGFAFSREQGIYVEWGCAAPYSLAKAGDSLIWLAQSMGGQIKVVQTNGYQARRISTHAIEYAIGQYSTVSDAISYVYYQEGHEFYVITFPTGNATWVYDTTTEAWHQRAALAGGVYNRHQGNCAVSYGGQVVVGDSLSGNLFAFDLNTTTDNGVTRKWLRSWRAVQAPPEYPMRFNNLQIDMQTGINVPDGTNPLVMLRWSDDGGHNWSNERLWSAGAPGETAKRVRFTRLGSTRRESGLDRMFELSSSDAFPVALIGASINS